MVEIGWANDWLLCKIMFDSEWIMWDYFSPNHVHNERNFKHGFCMTKFLFHLVVVINVHNPYFIQRWDACGAMGLSIIEKCIVAIQMLSYGMSTNVMDEYVCVRENTTMESLRCFCWAISEDFKLVYLHQPNKNAFEKNTWD
jgi:hypothetical protein